MELRSAICPKCNKEVTIDSSEEVVFCEICGKPFKAWEGVKLYTEHTEREKAAQKPSDEAIVKFNAILKEDYKLSYTHVEDVINREYPPECKKHISFSSYNNLFSWICFQPQDIQRNIKEKKEALNNIRSVNPQIAEMYYKILCSYTNSLCEKENRCHCSGELPFLKMRFRGIYEYLENYVKRNFGYYLNLVGDGITEELKCEDRLKGYDDEFVAYVIGEIERFIRRDSSLRVAAKSWISNLEKFYTYAKKKQVDMQHEEEERLKKERKEAERLKKEIAFWQKYIDLLKKRKAKEARALLESNKRTNTDEFTKFKKGLFGVKYLGDVSSLNAETLAGAPTVKSV